MKQNNSLAKYYNFFEPIICLGLFYGFDLSSCKQKIRMVIVWSETLETNKKPAV